LVRSTLIPLLLPRISSLRGLRLAGLLAALLLFKLSDMLRMGPAGRA